MNPTVGQPLEPNRHHWRKPEYRGDSGAEWVREHGFGAEDWNFDLTQALGGYVYGYGQGPVGKDRRDASARFDVLFYVRDPDGTYRAAGLYLNAEYLHEEDAVESWQLLRKSGIVERRSADLRAAFGRHRAAADKAVGAFEGGTHVRWRVAEQDVIVFEDLPAFQPLRDTDWRATNAYDWSDHPWSQLVPVVEREPEAHEGRIVLRVHRHRERSAEFRKAVIKRRKAAAVSGRIACEVCGFDFGVVYGSDFDDFIEAHHTVPLSTHPGSRLVSADEIALLCANCHRVAHRAQAYTVPKIRELLTLAVAR